MDDRIQKITKVLITRFKLCKSPNILGPENIKGAKIIKFLIQCFALIKSKSDDIIIYL